MRNAAQFGGARLGVGGCAQQRGTAIEDHAHRHIHQQLASAALSVNAFMKVPSLSFKDQRRNAAADVNATTPTP